jgi:hypothetical protein
MRNLHKEFVRLGRERNKITYKLLAMLPKIEKLKIYENEGYGSIYDYAARIAGLSPGVVGKALKLEKKLQNMPHLQKAVETQGINKVGIVAGLATEENEKELAEKIVHMSKPALQEYSKEKRGKITTGWKVELDEKMMFLFLKLKKKLGKNLSNKECLRKILEKMEEKPKPHKQAKETIKIPGEKVSRHISVHQKRTLSEQCIHPSCHRPAEIIHHPDRFSVSHDHENLKPLCKQHHEFAHNGITESMQPADYHYRKHRLAAITSKEIVIKTSKFSWN